MKLLLLGAISLLIYIIAWPYLLDAEQSAADFTQFGLLGLGLCALVIARKQQNKNTP